MRIFTKMLCAAALLAAGQRASAQTLLDDFENTRLLNYPAAQGTLTQGADNPFKAAPIPAPKWPSSTVRLMPRTPLSS